MRTYEELPGEKGNRIYYRAERYKARDLFKRLPPEVLLDSMPYSLCDLSMNGLAAYATRGANRVHEPGDRLPIRLEVRGATLHEGVGEVSRVEPTPLGTKLGIRLTDRCLSIPQLVSKYQETLIEGDLNARLGEVEAAVCPEYRQFAADVLHLLRSCRVALDGFAETRPEPAAAEEMLARCEERVLPRWHELWRRGNMIVQPVMGDPAALRAIKQFTELVLTPEFMAGAIWKRSYEKPLGYPGDFQVMNMVYAWQREGSGLYDQLVHRLGLDVAECIATRGVMMRQAIAETILRRRDEERPTRIASLGCGPAREVVEYLRLRELPGHAQFTLVDQDHSALSQAYEQTLPEVMRLHGQASVNCLNASFTQIMKAGDLFGKLPLQDLIYTVGLIDYLSPRRARNLVAALYEHLAPGGRLIIGNMMETAQSNLWPMEFLSDWNILYRNEGDMMALADGLSGAASVGTSLDPTGRVCLLTVDKA